MPTPFGQYGSLFNYLSPAGSGRYETAPGWTPQNSGLPEWIQSQFSYGPTNQGGDGDQNSNNQWQLNQGSFGAVRDQNGHPVVQVGDPQGWAGAGTDFGIRDRGRVSYDPGLGYITDPSNMSDVRSNDTARFLAMYAAMVGGGALAGLGSGAAAGAEGGAAASPFAGATAGAEGGFTSPFAGGAAEAFGGTDAVAGGGIGGGAAGGGDGGNPFGGASASGAGSNSLIGDSTLGQGATGLLQGAMGNPLRALGLIQMAGGLLGGRGNHAPSGGGSGASKTSGGGAAPAINTQRPAWTPNPYTAAQLNQLYGSH